ncbi:hypothetical protein QJQ45_027200 [Haematococcus lacustris]|nr:hypothetical protein QJQ45_027200 [Haematococcus lacustris]
MGSIDGAAWSLKDEGAPVPPAPEVLLPAPLGLPLAHATAGPLLLVPSPAPAPGPDSALAGAAGALLPAAAPAAVAEPELHTPAVAAPAVTAAAAPAVAEPLQRAVLAAAAPAPAPALAHEAAAVVAPSPQAPELLAPAPTSAPAADLNLPAPSPSPAADLLPPTPSPAAAADLVAAIPSPSPPADLLPPTPSPAPAADKIPSAPSSAAAADLSPPAPHPVAAPAPVLSPEDLSTMVVFERQLLGLLQRDAKGMPLDLLVDLLQYTTTQPRFDGNAEVLAGYLAHLQAQGAVAWEPASQQWRALRKPTPPAYTPRKTSPKPAAAAAATPRAATISTPPSPAPAPVRQTPPTPVPAAAAAARVKAAPTARASQAQAAAALPSTPVAAVAPAASPTQAGRVASRPPLGSGPQGPRVAYPAAGPLATWVVNEEQLFGLLANFSALPVDRLQSLMQTTMVEPQYTGSQQDLAAYLVQLEAQGFVSKDARGWYTVARTPALPSATERPPTPRPRARLPVSKPSDFAVPAPAPPPARPQARTASPVPVAVRVPTPQPSGAAYPAALRAFAPFETQVLGLVSNFHSIPLERLHSVMALTMVSPRFDRTQAELAMYLDWLVDQGLLSHDEQGWYAYSAARSLPARSSPPLPATSPAPAQPAAEPTSPSRAPAPKPTRSASPASPRLTPALAAADQAAPASPAPALAAADQVTPAPAPLAPAPLAPAPEPARSLVAAAVGSVSALTNSLPAMVAASSPTPQLVPAVVGVPASAMPQDVPIWWPTDQVEAYRARQRETAAKAAAVAAAAGSQGAGKEGGEMTTDQKGLLLVGVVAAATMVLALGGDQQGARGAKQGQVAAKAVVQQQLRRPTDKESEKGRVDQTRVRRYWAGKAPEWAADASLAELQLGDREAVRTEIAAPTIIRKADPRLSRLAASRAEDVEEVRERHREIRAAEIVRRRHDDAAEDAGRRDIRSEDPDQGAETHSDSEEDDELDQDSRRHRHAQQEEEDEEEQLRKRQAVRERLLLQQKAVETQVAAQHEEEEEEVAMPRTYIRSVTHAASIGVYSSNDANSSDMGSSSGISESSSSSSSSSSSNSDRSSRSSGAIQSIEESSEYETDSDEEGAPGRRLLKPVFVPKESRETIAERLRQEQEEIEALEKEKKRAEERKLETRQIVAQTVAADALAAKAAAEEVQAAGGALEDVDTDEDDDEVAFEAWKVRELARIKAEREERKKQESEALERERLKNMTDEERAAWERANPKETKHEEKKKWRFMQKYWHKGAYFQEAPDESRGTTAKDDIFQRDYSAPTGEDKINKEILPKIMQVKNFGRSGRTKWTHLLAEDTTNFEDPLTQTLASDRRRALPGANMDFSKPKKFKT